MGTFLGQTCGASSIAGVPLTNGLGCLGDSRRAGDEAFAAAFVACGGVSPVPLNTTAVCGTRRTTPPLGKSDAMDSPVPIMAVGMLSFVVAVCMTGWA